MPAQYGLNFGVPKKLFDAAVPSAALNSPEYSVPRRVDGARTKIRWTYEFATDPSALSLKLQGSLNANDPDPAARQWFDLDTLAVLTGGANEVEANVTFIRARVETVTGGTGITVTVLI